MGDKANTHPGAAGRATAADHPASVRNVVLVGHSGSGKTTLVEALALTAGAVTRAGRVEDGGTVSDYDEIEHRQQRSVQLSLVPVEWDGYKINILDTPGYADFVGELRAGLRAADAALFVVSASDGVDGSTRMVWEECAAVGMPRAIVVTHLESARADFDDMTRICAEAFGADDPDAVLPLYLPLHGAPGPDGHAPVTGLTGLLSQKLFDYSSGERKESEPGPSSSLSSRRPATGSSRGSSRRARTRPSWTAIWAARRSTSGRWSRTWNGPSRAGPSFPCSPPPPPPRAPGRASAP